MRTEMLQFSIRPNANAFLHAYETACMRVLS